MPQTQAQPKKQRVRPKKERETDLVRVGIIAVYLTQMLGKPTLEEIRTAASEKLFCTIHPKTLERALEAAKRRELVSINQDSMEDGVVRKVYSMKKIRWKAPPEYAHIKALWPKLVSSEEGMVIKAMLDMEAKAGEVKTRSGPRIRDYHTFRVKAVLLTDIIGSQIRCPRTDEVRKKWGIATPSVVLDLSDDKDDDKKKKKKALEIPMEGIFVIDELTGAYVLPQDMMQGWFGTNLRYLGLGDATSTYVSVQPVHIHPKQQPIQLVLPVNNKHAGPAPPKSHECIRAGEEIEINFMAPTTGAMTAELWEAFMILGGLMPLRGISPARGRRFGRFLVIGFEDLGPVDKPGGGLGFVGNLVPDAVMEKYGSYLKDAMSRLGSTTLSIDKKAGANGSGNGTPTNGE